MPLTAFVNHMYGPVSLAARVAEQYEVRCRLTCTRSKARPYFGNRGSVVVVAMLVHFTVGHLPDHARKARTCPPERPCSKCTLTIGPSSRTLGQSLRTALLAVPHCESTAAIRGTLISPLPGKSMEPVVSSMLRSAGAITEVRRAEMASCIVFQQRPPPLILDHQAPELASVSQLGAISLEISDRKR